MNARSASSVAVLAAAVWLPSKAAAMPIPSVSSSPAYVGRPATAHRVHGVAATPRNPFMAPNGRSEIHDDGWQTDAYAWGGALRVRPVLVACVRCSGPNLVGS